MGKMSDDIIVCRICKKNIEYVTVHDYTARCFLIDNGPVHASCKFTPWYCFKARWIRRIKRIFLWDCNEL
jgi:hypothetical protein